jgi:hypothetical protein
MIIFDLSMGGIPEPLPIACFVARVRPEGMGVEWRELAPQIVSDLLLFASRHPAVHGNPSPRWPSTGATRRTVAVKSYAG